MNKEIKDVGFSWSDWIHGTGIKCNHRPGIQIYYKYNSSDGAYELIEEEYFPCKCTDEEKRKDGIM